MFERLLLLWQQIYHFAFNSIFRTTPEVSSKLTLLKYVKSQRSYGFLNHKRADFWLPNFGFKNDFSASLNVDFGLDLKAHCTSQPP